jgi:hypothetical protein
MPQHSHTTASRPRAIDVVKSEISSKYLGTAGIHGVALRLDEKCIVIYVDGSGTAAYRTLWDRIRREARPYKLKHSPRAIAL